MRKKVLIIVAAIFVVAGSFAGGFYVGLNFFSVAFATSDLKEAYVDLISLELRMEQLDRGDYKALRETLNMQIDSEVIRINSHLDKAEKQQEINKAKGWLRRVAKHRIDYPATYPKEVDSEDHRKGVEYVKQILNSAMSGEGNKGAGS